MKYIIINTLKALIFIFTINLYVDLVKALLTHIKTETVFYQLIKEWKIILNMYTI